MPGQVGRPSQKDRMGRIRRPFRRAGRDREALQEGWEALPVGWEGLGGPSGVPREAGRSSQRAGMGRETLPVGGTGREALPEGQEVLGGPLGGLGVLGGLPRGSRGPSSGP